jgi:ribosomal protein S18 acetylase RimI-like enzyme
VQQQDIELQPLGVNDAALLRAIAVQAYSDHYADTWYDNGLWYMQTYFSLTRLQEELAETNARFFLIYFNGTAVGFIKLNFDKPLSKDGKDATELERIYLVKKVSGQGIGTYVLNFVFAFVREQNIKLIWLKVMDTNPGAIGFYKKMGFEICNTHQVDFVQKKEGMRGMYIMQKSL